MFKSLLSGAGVPRVLLSSLLFLIGCRTFQEPQGLLEATAPESTLRSSQLQAMMLDVATTCARRIEQGADAVLAADSNPEVRRRALLWKIHGVASVLEAASRPDPYATYFDLWVLGWQMEDLFQRNPGPFSETARSQAIATSVDFRAPLIEVERLLPTQPAYGSIEARDFAATHPLRDLSFQRASLSAAYANTVQVPQPSTVAVVASLHQDLRAIRRLSNLQAEFLPKQARWQAELLAYDLERTGSVQRGLHSAALAADASQRLAQTVESAQILLDRQAAALPVWVSEERRQMLQELGTLQAATHDWLRQERIEALATFHNEADQFHITVSELATQLSNDLRADLRQGVQRAEGAGDRWIETVVNDLRRMSVGMALAFLAALASFWIWLVAHWRHARQLHLRSLPTPTIAMKNTPESESQRRAA